MPYGGAIYEIIDVQRLDGELILNTYFYINSGVSSVAEVGDLWIADVLPAVVPIQSVDLNHETIRVRNILSTDAYSEQPTDQTGSVEIEAFPRAVAANYTLKTASRLVRPGSKRYGGIPETFSNHNVWNFASGLVAFENLRLQLSAPLEGTLSNYTPAIVKRIPYEAPSGRTAYRLPETGAEAEVFEVTVALFSINVSHQVSRGN